MRNNQEPLSDRIFQRLLYVLPFDFRGEYGADMEETFRQQREHADRGGRLFRLWRDTAVDLFRTAPREHLSVLSQDVRYALRILRKNLGQTIAAVLILGLGIGANTAIFSVVNSVLLRPLPYTDGAHLVTIRQQALRAGIPDLRFSVSEIEDYRQRAHSVAGVAEYHSMEFTLFGRGEAQRVMTGVVSAGFFDLFGVKPIAGRTFIAADDQPNAPAVLVLSYEFWKQKLKGDPHVVGKTFEMNDRVHTVIGVLPPIPQYPDENDVYMPTSACPTRSSARVIGNRDFRMMRVFARMKPEMSLEHCRRDLAGVAHAVESDHPKSYTSSMGYGVAATSLSEELTRDARPTLIILLAAAAFVLLIACANVANLTLARMARRERELVVRTALGAGNGRLMRQLLTENLILALIAAAAGLAFAAGSLELLVQFATRLTPRAREIHIDGSVLAFATLCAMVTSLVFGSAAALYSRHDIASALKDGNSQTTAGVRRSRMRGILIAAQVAFSYVLLVGAGLMVRSLINLERVDTGFIHQGAVAMQVNLNWSKYRTPQQWRDVAERILREVSSQPGVISAAVSSSFPFNSDDGGWTERFVLEGKPLPAGEIPPAANVRSASNDYFRTLGIPLLRGRLFNSTDAPDSPAVAVISQSLAKHYWKDDDPVGRRVSFGRGEKMITIAGVVGDVREFRLDQDPQDQFYRPVTQAPSVGGVVVRTAGDPMALSRQIRSAIASVDPQTAVTNVTTLEQARSESIASPRTSARLLSLFAVLALIIAATGIAGMLALSVNQRLREIGIRVAVGATPGLVIRDVVGHGMALVLGGAITGAVGAALLTRAAKTLLFQVGPTDPITYAGVLFVLIGAALAACYLPARRAARVDVLRALRCE